VKYKLTVEACRWLDNQATLLRFEGFMQVLQVFDDVTFGQAGRLRKVPGGQGLGRETLQQAHTVALPALGGRVAIRHAGACCVQ
jgi:hypothetical protein